MNTTFSRPKEKLSFKERFSKKDTCNKKKEKSQLESNIISVNFLKTDISPNVFGIDKLLKTTLFFLKKDNPFNANNFEQLQIIKNDLDKININKEKDDSERNKLKEKANKYFQTIANENSLLSGCKDIIDILEKAKYDSNLFFIYLISVAFFFPFLHTDNEIINRYIRVFKKIENCYKIFTDEISIIPLISKNEENLHCFGFKICEHLRENDSIKNEIIKQRENSLKELKNNKIKIKEINLYVNGEKKILATNIFGDSLCGFKRYLICYFENYIKRQCCIDYILRQKNIYSNLFEQIEEMSNKNDWDEFHIQII